MTGATTSVSVSMSLTATLLALSSPFAWGEKAATPGVITCERPFDRYSSHIDLVKAFRKDVVYQEIEGAAGRKIKASVLYPDDPKARLEFIWSEEKARRRPSSIRARDQSAWTTTHGIRIGMPLAEVEKLNGKPFKLSGFDWDYGGRVTDWQGGALSKPQRGGCVIGVEFVHPEDSPEANLTKVSGDSEFLSDNADIRAVEPFVGAVTVSYPKR